MTAQHAIGGGYDESPIATHTARMLDAESDEYEGGAMADWSPEASAAEWADDLVAETPTPPAPQKPVQPIIVVGSFDWEGNGAVQEALINWINAHDGVTPMLITSGCPQGAELAARALGEVMSWQMQIMRDEELVQVSNAIVFGFIRDESEGATRVLEQLSRRVWTRIFRDETVRQASAWVQR